MSRQCGGMQWALLKQNYETFNYKKHQSCRTSLLVDFGRRLIRAHLSEFLSVRSLMFLLMKIRKVFPEYLSYKSDFQECKSSKSAQGGFERSTSSKDGVSFAFASQVLDQREFGVRKPPSWD